MHTVIVNIAGNLTKIQVTAEQKKWMDIHFATMEATDHAAGPFCICICPAQI